MYRKVIYPKTSLRVYEVTEGEMIEQRIERMLNNKEPMPIEGSERMYQTRAEGIHPMTDPRTDRFDQALTMTENVAKQRIAKREAIVKDINGKTESADGQSSSSGDPTGETK